MFFEVKFPRKGIICRNNYFLSCPEVLFKKQVIKSFTKLLRKELCYSLSSIKLRAAKMFSYEICKMFNNSFFIEHLEITTSLSLEMKLLWMYSDASSFLLWYMTFDHSKQSNVQTVLLKIYGKIGIRGH